MSSISSCIPSCGYSVKHALYLAKEGDSLRISSTFYNSLGGYISLDEIPQEQRTIFHPLASDATACKTHEQVLEFLKKIKKSEFKNDFSFNHSNNLFYESHLGTHPKGRAHMCALDKQIGFVKYKILEKEHGLRHPDTWLFRKMNGI